MPTRVANRFTDADYGTLPIPLGPRTIKPCSCATSMPPDTALEKVAPSDKRRVKSFAMQDPVVA